MKALAKRKVKLFTIPRSFSILNPLELPFSLSVGLSPLGCAQRESREFDQGIPNAHAVTMQQHRGSLQLAI